MLNFKGGMELEDYKSIVQKLQEVESYLRTGSYFFIDDLFDFEIPLTKDYPDFSIVQTNLDIAMAKFMLPFMATKVILVKNEIPTSEDTKMTSMEKTSPFTLKVTIKAKSEFDV